MAHSALVLRDWDRLMVIANQKTGEKLEIDGRSLDVAVIVAVARYGLSLKLSDSTHGQIEQSARVLESALARGECLYGINTGFGGNADVRSNDVGNLQRTIVRQLQYGILSSRPAPSSPPQRQGNGFTNGSNGKSDKTSEFFRCSRPNEDRFAATSMPESWIRASMLIRANSLATGHSGVSLGIVEGIINLLGNDILPLMPLRGSISASGDLSPLSYLAGALQGSPCVDTWVGQQGRNRRLVPANEGLSLINMVPRDLGPKEGLAITNGTSVSAGVAALALHDANQLAILAQVLTAMGVEALTGSAESFDQFIADVRPHPGQLDSCRNIRGFLSGSKLLTSHSSMVGGGVMRQDRYALRTSTQWIGPQLEDLGLAHSQIIVDCNATTDNPLIDVGSGAILHGGNFQAQAITSAVEKIRLSAQRIGRMLFAQSTEIVNPILNNGLPPNLVADEPSRSFLMKGVDIATAAYVSELGFLANPVGSHVQTAELGNQSINSLALISARYTHTALDLLSHLSAAYLFSLCQALDLRAFQIRFFDALFPIFRQSAASTLWSFGREEHNRETFLFSLWKNFIKEFQSTTSMDSGPAFHLIFSRLTGLVISCDMLRNESKLLAAVKVWASAAEEEALSMFLFIRDQYARYPGATPFLGRASRRMYSFVRHDLGIPFLKHEAMDALAPNDFSESFHSKGTAGTLMTTIYDAIRSGELYVPVMECLRESMAERDDV